MTGALEAGPPVGFYDIYARLFKTIQEDTLKKEIVISDLSVCRPAHRLDRGYRHETWRLIDYETEEFAGTMIYSGPGMNSGELVLPLDCEGYCAIFLGVHYPSQFGDVHVRLRLSDDPAYSLVRAETPMAKDMGALPESLKPHFTAKQFADYQVSETFWRIADLSGQDLSISRFNEGGEGNAGSREYAGMFSSLVFLRLVPLTPEEVALHREEKPRAETRRLMAMNDGGIFSHLSTVEDIHAQLEPYRDSDVGIMLWATFKGENCTYRSRIGRTLPTALNPFDRFAVNDAWDKTLRRLEEKGIDFMREVVETAHGMDLRIFSSLRLQGPKPVPVEMEPGTFYERHPEFRCKDRNGLDIAHLSLAFPEVRDLWISLLCETLEYGFDGVHVLFCRSHPFVLYEDPVIARFAEKYGEDARQCPEDDPRLWQVMAEFVTCFARQLRREVEAIAARTGRKMEIAYSINSSMQSRLLAPGVDPATRSEVEGGTGRYDNAEVMQSNLMWGVDIEALVREGLADYLLPHPAFARNAADWLPPLVEMVKGTSVEIYPDLYPRRQPPAAALYSAETLYALGCDGISLWDTYARVPRISEWAMMRRLGHCEEIPTWRRAGKGDDYFRVLNFKQLGVQSGDPRYFQTNG